MLLVVEHERYEAEEAPVRTMRQGPVLFPRSINMETKFMIIHFPPKSFLLLFHSVTAPSQRHRVVVFFTDRAYLLGAAGLLVGALVIRPLLAVATTTLFRGVVLPPPPKYY